MSEEAEAAPRGANAALAAAMAVSAAALVFLLWLIYGREPGAEAPEWVRALPATNAVLNAISASLVVGGLRAIGAGRRATHPRWMVAALLCSTLFLASYITYHHFAGDTPFEGTGWIRPIYFAILITHIIGSMVVVPAVAGTVVFAVTGRWARHRRWARRTAPLWLYVSVTGVAIFVMLRLWGT